MHMLEKKDLKSIIYTSTLGNQKKKSKLNTKQKKINDKKIRAEINKTENNKSLIKPKVTL